MIKLLSFFIFFSSTCLKAEKTIKILTSIEPQRFIVEKLMSSVDTYKLNAVVRIGESPELFRPKPSLLKKLSSTDIYFKLNLPFENLYINKIHKKALVVDTTQDTTFLYLTNHNKLLSNSNHARNKLRRDPHIWLSPKSLEKQIIIIARTLSGVFKSKRKIINKNKESLLTDLQNNILKAKKILKPYKGKSILVFHPAFSYYLNFFGLEQLSIQNGHKISYSVLNNLETISKEKAIDRIFIQSTEQTPQIKNIAQKIGLKIVILKAIPKDPVSNILEIAEKISGAK